LIAACFERRIEEYARAAEEALADPDAWSGFCGYVERVCAMQAADRGLKDVLTRTFPRAKGLEEHRTRGYEATVTMIERAKAQGTLRQDFVPEDLVLLLMANAGVVQAAGEAAPAAWQRFVGLALDGCRSEGASDIPAPSTPRQMLLAMARIGGPAHATRENRP
jgi:hypothetical protein